MARFQINTLGASDGSAVAPFCCEGATLAAALASVNVKLGAAVTGKDGQEYNRVDRMTDEGAVVAALILATRVPTDGGKGAYKTAAERAETPQDKGGSSRKVNIRQPFAMPERVIPATVGANGKPVAERVMPAGGCYVNKAERKAAIMDLARAGLGTLNGIAVGGVANACPPHGYTPTAAQADKPLCHAELHRPESIGGDKLLARVRQNARKGGEESAPRYGSVKRRRNSIARRRLAS